VDREITGQRGGVAYKNPPKKKPAAHGHGLNHPVLWQLGCPLGTRSFPSHDCSWFGFVSVPTYLLIFIAGYHLILLSGIWGPLYFTGECVSDPPFPA
jgi:hypothetical protein